MRNFTPEELEEMYDYLDDVRESGIVNMFGAGSILEDTFDLNKREARSVLSDWMKNFGKRGK